MPSKIKRLMDALVNPTGCSSYHAGKCTFDSICCARCEHVEKCVISWTPGSPTYHTQWKCKKEQNVSRFCSKVKKWWWNKRKAT